jgi:hypothetical protein
MRGIEYPGWISVVFHQQGFEPRTFLNKSKVKRLRRFDVRPIPAATYLRESVLPIRLRPDFLVVFEGCAGGAEYWPCRHEARKRSLRHGILRGLARF